MLYLLCKKQKPLDAEPVKQLTQVKEDALDDSNFSRSLFLFIVFRPMQTISSYLYEWSGSPRLGI